MSEMYRDSEKTLKSEIPCVGVGLHSGQKITMTLKPAPVGTGIVFVRTDIHVNAHFLICYVTLVIMRVIEHMLKEEFTTKELREALCRYSCSYLDQNYYLFDYRDKVIDAIGEKYGWDLSKKYMSQAEIKNILKHKPKNRFSNNSLQR